MLPVGMGQNQFHKQRIGIGQSCGGSVHHAECVRSQIVVGIKHQDEVARGLRQPQIARHSLATIVRRLHHDNVGEPSGVFLQNLPRIVGRAVVDADVLNVLTPLCNDRVEALTKIGPGIVDGGENGERHGVWARR